MCVEGSAMSRMSRRDTLPDRGLMSRYVGLGSATIVGRSMVGAGMPSLPANEGKGDGTPERVQRGQREVDHGSYRAAL